MASLEDQYQKAWQLYQEESHLDPDSEPYKSKYAAREIFEELKSRLSKQLDEDDVDDGDEGAFNEEGVDGVGLTRARMAAVVYHLGVIAVDTEEFSTGEEHLNKALTIIGDEDGIASGVSSATVGDAELASAALFGDAESLLSVNSETASVSPTAINPATVALAISCHNQLGILWSNRAMYSTAKSHLDRANTLYDEFQKQSTKPPRTLNSLFSSSERENSWDDNSGAVALEKLHTLTFYYLAQVSARLCCP